VLGLGPVGVVGAFDVPLGHLALDDSRGGACASGGVESAQESLEEGEPAGAVATAIPGCVMAPWGASVNGTDALIASPTTTDACTGPTTIAAPNGIQAAAEINVHMVTSGRVQINGATALSAQIDAGCLTTTGAVTLARATLTRPPAWVATQAGRLDVPRASVADDPVDVLAATAGIEVSTPHVRWIALSYGMSS